MSDDKVKLTGWLAASGRVAFLLLFATVRVLVAPPNNSARFAQESAAIKAIQTIQTMQVQCNSQYGHFATSLKELGPPERGSANAAAADLIEGGLAAGERSGYKFDMTGNQIGYAISAVPVAYGDTARRSFYSDQTMAIHEHNGPEPATARSKSMH